MTNLEIKRLNELISIKRDLLKLRSQFNGMQAYLKVSNKIDDLYFDNVINDNEHTNLKQWLDDIQ